MNRRNPTRIELKLDDLNEFESAKKELETVEAPNATVDETPMETSSTPVSNKPLTRQSIVLRTT